jgi:hypothetical protein
MGMLKRFVSGLRNVIAGSLDLSRFLVPYENFFLWVDGRDWQLDFGPVVGKAGEVKTIESEPGTLFCGEKIIATDSKDGRGTRIGQILIGQRFQCMPGLTATLTKFFDINAVGNGVRWDNCRRGEKIKMTVSFIEDCTFDATVFGRAAI